MSTKKRVLVILVVFFSVSAVVFFSRPRIEIQTNLYPVHLPVDLDEYLIQSEAQYANIVPGVQKAIVWANESKKEKTKYTLVYIHGLLFSPILKGFTYVEDNHFSYKLDRHAVFISLCERNCPGIKTTLDS
jgi:hypothetical protein